MPVQPDKNNRRLINIPIDRTGISISGSVVQNRGRVYETIQFPTTAKALTLPEARNYADAIIQCINWAAKQGANKPGKGKPGIVVNFAGDDPTLVIRRSLMLSDDRLFVVIRRYRLGFGMYTKPMISIEEWVMNEMREPISLAQPRILPTGSPAAAQAARSIAQAGEDAMAWK